MQRSTAYNGYYHDNRTLWLQIRQINEGLVSVKGLHSYFQRLDIVPGIVSDREFFSLCELADRSNGNLEYLDFLHFLYLLELISDMVLSKKKDINNKLLAFIQVIAERQFFYAMELALSQVLTLHGKNVPITEKEATLILFMWLKSSGWLLLTDGKPLTLYLSCVKIAKSSLSAAITSSNGSGKGTASPKMPFNISEMVRGFVNLLVNVGKNNLIFAGQQHRNSSLMNQIIANATSTDKGDRDGFNRHFAMLSLLTPTLFFPMEVEYHPSIITMYSLENVTLMARNNELVENSLSSFLVPFITSTQLSALVINQFTSFSHMAMSNPDPKVLNLCTVLQLRDACASYGILTSNAELADFDRIVKAYSFRLSGGIAIFGGSINCGIGPGDYNKGESCLKFCDVIEVLYLITSSRYTILKKRGNMNSSGVPSGSNSVEIVFNYFVNLLTLNLARYDLHLVDPPQPPQLQRQLTSSSQSSMVQEKSATSSLNGIPSSSSDDRSVESGNSSNSSTSNDSISDIVKLLVHYPLSTFELNPWKVFSIYSQVESSLAKHNPSSTSAENVVLTRLLKAFGQQYDISLSDLSAFFAAYYDGAKEKTKPSINGDSKTGKGYDFEMKQKSIKSLILHYAMHKQVMRLLSLNEDLLKFEFGRCYSFNNPSPVIKDHFKADVILAPQLSIASMKILPQDITIRSEAAIAWAREVINSGSSSSGSNAVQQLITKHFNETVALSGFVCNGNGSANSPNPAIVNSCDPLGLQSKALTFSTFVIFAIRCFTFKLFVGNESNSLQQVSNGKGGTQSQQGPYRDDLEKQFMTEVKRMLNIFSDRLSKTQQILQLRILVPLYDLVITTSSSVAAGVTLSSTTNPLTVEESSKLSLCSYAVDVFRQRMNPIFNAATNKGIYTADRVIPPRPPSHIWDAPRFIEFAKFFGLFASQDISIDSLWTTFGFCLSEELASSIEGWDVGHVSPLPMAVAPSTVIRFLDQYCRFTSEALDENRQAVNSTPPQWHATNEEELYHHILLPSVVGIAEHLKRNPATFQAKPNNLPLIEDLLRYGGSQATQYLIDQQGFLRMSYYCLQDRAAATISPASLKPFSSSIEGMHALDVAKLEVPLTSVAKFFSCHQLLSINEIVGLAKLSIHNRLRSVYRSRSPSGSTASAVFPSSGGKSGSSSTQQSVSQGAAAIDYQEEMITLSFNEFEELFIRSAFHAWYKVVYDRITRTLASQKISETYQHECLKSLEECSLAYDNAHKRWGKNFIRPYMTCLQKFSEFSIQVINNFKAIGGFDRPRFDQYFQKKCWGIDPFSAASTSGKSKRSVKSDLRSQQLGRGEQLSMDVAGVAEGDIGDDDNEDVDGGDDNATVSSLNTLTTAASNASINSMDNTVRSSKSQQGKAVNVQGETAVFGSNIGTTPHAVDSLTVADAAMTSNNSDNSNRTVKKTLQEALKLPPDAISDKRKASNPNVKTSSASIAEILSPQTFQHAVADPASRKAERRLIPSGASGFLGANNNNGRVDDRGLAQINEVALQKALQQAKISMNLSVELDEEDSIDKIIPNPTSEILIAAKEALWPVFATYCSCGDSMDPGKLSGPNLFTLLSKLGVLTHHTLLTDVGIVFHQVATRSFSSDDITTVRTLLASHGNRIDSPSLTFEEFLVFLYAFSELRYEGNFVSIPQDDQSLLSTGSSLPTPTAIGRPKSRGVLNEQRTSSEIWLRRWQEKMTNSSAFQRLLKECVMPVMERQTLLAFPEDARLRDRFSSVFALQALVAVESTEGPLQSFFEREMRSQVTSFEQSSSNDGNNKKNEAEIFVIMLALKRIGLIPKIMNEVQVLQLVKDVLPEYGRNLNGQHHIVDDSAHHLLFPQWEWVLCVVAFQAVETAVMQSSTPTDPQVLTIIPLILLSLFIF